MIEWIKKKIINPFICFLKETHFRPRDIMTESEGMEKDIPCKWTYDFIHLWNLRNIKDNIGEGKKKQDKNRAGDKP